MAYAAVLAFGVRRAEPILGLIDRGVYLGALLWLGIWLAWAWNG